MNCPYCGKDNNSVIDSRPMKISGWLRRRRDCHECGERFTTTEIPIVKVDLMQKIEALKPLAGYFDLSVESRALVLSVIEAFKNKEGKNNEKQTDGLE